MKLTIEYPETLPDLLQQEPGDLEEEMRGALAAKLYEMKRIPSGVAAQMAGVNRVDFLLRLSKYGVAAIDMAHQELIRDIKNAT